MGMFTGFLKFIVIVLVATATAYMTIVYIVPPVMAADLPGMIAPYQPAIEEQANTGMDGIRNGTDSVRAEMRR